MYFLLEITTSQPGQATLYDGSTWPPNLIKFVSRSCEGCRSWGLSRALSSVHSLGDPGGSDLRLCQLRTTCRINAETEERASERARLGFSPPAAESNTHCFCSYSTGQKCHSALPNCQGTAKWGHPRIQGGKEKHREHLPQGQASF